MAEVKELPIEYAAFVAIHSLKKPDQQKIEARLAELAATPLSEWERLGFRRSEADPTFGIINADDSLRIMIEFSPDSAPSVIDVFRQARLDAFQKARSTQE